MEKQVALTWPAAAVCICVLHIAPPDAAPIVRWSGAADVFGTAVYTCLPHTASSPWASQCNA